MGDKGDGGNQQQSGWGSLGGPVFTLKEKKLNAQLSGGKVKDVGPLSLMLTRWGKVKDDGLLS